MGILIIVVAVLYIAIRVLLESNQKSYDSGSVECKNPGSQKAFNQDVTKRMTGEMSKREFDQNIRNGKYR